MQLRGQNVLITGGSAGLGAAVARRFASEGANLALNYANGSERAERLRDSLVQDFPGLVVVLLQGDVSASSVCTDLVSRTVAALGGIDCVVSNAGWTRAAPWEDLDALTEQEWDRTWAMNVKAHLFLFRAAKVHFLRNARGGNMIITSSVAGIAARGSALAYSVSKHGTVALARGLALHQGPKCRINTVAPGLLETDWAVQQFGEERIRATREAVPLKMVSLLSLPLPSM